MIQFHRSSLFCIPEPQRTWIGAVQSTEGIELKRPFALGVLVGAAAVGGAWWLTAKKPSPAALVAAAPDSTDDIARKYLASLQRQAA